MIFPFHIILGSNSPRRKELLHSLGFTFSVMPSDIDESIPTQLPANEAAEYLAVKKADFLKNRLKENEILITSDTVVILGNQILNKPEDKQEAFSMLQQLSGNIHQVITGVCIISKSKTVRFSELTTVTFNEMSADDILHYIDQHHPMDKAGAYGIQDWIGMTSIKSIEGSFYNVMGLPTHRVYHELKNW